ncbi:MAG TPA: CpaF family protein [Acidimicrobiales bacterium]|nr:CpaF family protein [Acidimicrobiales bacterium]
MAARLDRWELVTLVRDEAPLLPAADVDAVVDRVLARIGGVGPLEPLLADPAVTDVLVNGPGAVWVERAGRLASTPVVLDRKAIALLVERVVAPLGLRADRSTPIVDARLPDGSRVHVVLPPLAVDGPLVTIRRFGATTLPLGAFCAPAVADLLVWAVHARLNTVVSGPTGAGKTTLLNALCRHLPAGERVVTVEDAAELRLPGDHVVRLETRPATPDGLAAVPVRELVRAALRMRPDRIVVGEVRGAETLDMLQAMNTGHDGSLSSCHANGPADALRRLETMALTGGDLPLAAVREQVAAAVDLVVHVSRGADGHRRVTAVAEVAEDPAAGARVRLLAKADTIVRAPSRRPRRPDVADAPTPSPSDGRALSAPASRAAAAPPAATMALPTSEPPPTPPGEAPPGTEPAAALPTEPGLLPTAGGPMAPPPGDGLVP